MKSRNFLILTLALGLVAATSAHRVEICHNVNNNPVTIKVAYIASVVHLALHSRDYEGICDPGDSGGFAR